MTVIAKKIKRLKSVTKVPLQDPSFIRIQIALFLSLTISNTQHEFLILKVLSKLNPRSTLRLLKLAVMERSII